MKNNQSRVLALLFKPETPPAYLFLSFCLCLLGFALVQTITADSWLQHLLLGVVLVGIARHFDSPLLRIFWWSLAALLSLVLVLDVASHLRG